MPPESALLKPNPDKLQEPDRIFLAEEDLLVCPMQPALSQLEVLLSCYSWVMDVHRYSPSPPERIPFPLILDMVQSSNDDKEENAQVRCNKIRRSKGVKKRPPAVEED